MSPATLQGIALLVAASVIYGAGFLSGWAMVGQDFAEYREDVALDALVSQAHAKVERFKIQKQLEALDARHTEAKRQAEAREQSLLADIESGRQRLSVLVRQCGAGAEPGAAGVDDGAVRAELDPAHGARVVSITREGDRAIRALSGLQDYVQQVCTPDGL